MRCAEKRSAVTAFGPVSVQYFYQRPGRWTGDPANLTSTQDKAGNDCKNTEIQAQNTNDLNKMEECLEKKTGCSSVRTTANIYTWVGKRKHTKMKGE